MLELSDTFFRAWRHLPVPSAFVLSTGTFTGRPGLRYSVIFFFFGGGGAVLATVFVRKHTTSSRLRICHSVKRLSLCHYRPWPSLHSVSHNFDILEVALCKGGGSGSVVGIATGYGLDDPEIESRWGRDFPHLSRPAVGPTQPPVRWIPGLSRGQRAAGAWRWPLTPF